MIHFWNIRNIRYTRSGEEDIIFLQNFLIKSDKAEYTFTS